jgi:hypothetical protein
MEQLPNQQEKSLSLELKQKEVEISKIAYQINLILPYPLNDFQIADWGKCINRFIPELKLETLQAIVDMFVTGQMEYDKNIGVQNIFKGFVFLVDKQIEPIWRLEQKAVNSDFTKEQEEQLERMKPEKERLINLKKPFEKRYSSQLPSVIV